MEGWKDRGMEHSEQRLTSTLYPPAFYPLDASIPLSLYPSILPAL